MAGGAAAEQSGQAEEDDGDGVDGPTRAAVRYHATYLRLRDLAPNYT